MSGMNGVSAYQQTNQIWSQNAKKSTETDRKTEQSGVKSEVKVEEWKPIDTKSSLVPVKQDGIGMAVGDVQLSDKAKDYYSKLKSKFGNMEFIAVSKDMMSTVKANAASYGSSGKMVVLIDDEKIERMANDESFRKKYEGIIAMAQSQLKDAKNSLASSGANVKSFGMSVNEDGSTSFFATLEKSSAEQAKRIEKKQAQKKAAQAREKKEAQKEAQEKRIEKAREEQKSEKSAAEKDDKEYVKLEADSFEELLNKISDYAFNLSEDSVLTDAEKGIGQLIDFKG